jgi:hypothetical protein
MKPDGSPYPDVVSISRSFLPCPGNAGLVDA